MASNFQKDFDTLFAAILADWQNQFPDADLSQGSLINIKSACLASALWGLYKYQDWIYRQIFLDTADSANLEHHAWIRDITRNTGETNAALLARVLEYIRRPPAGGNIHDYIKWALSVNNVAKAWCIPIPTLGHVDVIVLANPTTTGSEMPSSSARIGVVSSVNAGKLIDSAAAFTSAQTVAAGDIVENPLKQTRTTVVSVDSATQLTLNADIFKFAGEPYIVHCQTGTNTSVSAGKLVDSNGDFEDAVYTVKQGDIVENVTDTTQANIVSVDSATQVSLDSDIFTDTGKTYVIRGLIGEVKKYIDPVRPATASKVSIVSPTLVTETVTIAVTGSNLDNSAITAEITAYLNSMIPGQILYKARLSQIAMDLGADNAVVSLPAADITPTTYQMIRPGVITVSQ